MSDLKSVFEPLRRKHRLPSYEDIDREFELLYVPPVEDVTFPLRFVRRRMNEKMYWLCNLFQSVLQPNPSSLVNLHEAGAFSGEEKQSVFELLKELMQWERKSLALDVEGDDAADAAFIRDAFQFWMKKKPDVLRVTKKLGEAWQQADRAEQKGHYFG